MKKAIITLAIVGLLGSTGVAFAARTGSSVDTSCVRAAVEIRETTIGTAFDVFSVAMKNALSSRKSALDTAWTKTEKADRNAAVKSAWNTYKTGARNAHSALKSTRSNAWSTFRKVTKADCRAAEIDAGAEPKEEVKGSVAL